MRLILVRHGETYWNQQRRVQGISDIELNPAGRKHAQALARALSSESVEAIYTSPLKRARETAEAINRLHQVPLVVREGLRELDVGQIDGLTYQEMRSQHREFLSRWAEDPSSVQLPGGEGLHQVQDRAWAEVQEIVGRGQGVVVVVSHYFVILCVLCRALGLELSHLRRLKLDVGSTCVLELDSGRATLSRFNDTCHLREDLE